MKFYKTLEDDPNRGLKLGKRKDKGFTVLPEGL